MAASTSTPIPPEANTDYGYTDAGGGLALQLLPRYPELLGDRRRRPCVVCGYSRRGPPAVVPAARRSERVHRLAVGAPFPTAFPDSLAASRTYPHREIAEVLLTHPEQRWRYARAGVPGP